MAVHTGQFPQEWRDMVLQKISENAMDGTCEQQGSCNENRNPKQTYTYSQGDILSFCNT